MLIKEVIGEGTPQIYGKHKNQLKRRYRCAMGPRKGRIVADPATCTAPINIGKRMQMRATRAKRATMMGKLSQYTKKYNPTSKIVKKLNKQIKKRRKPSQTKSTLQTTAGRK